MCKYCEGEAQILNEALDIFIKESEITLDYDIGDEWDNFTTHIDINYCPFCGRKLK